MATRPEESTAHATMEGESLAVAVVRELLRTPGFKEAVLSHLREADPSHARRLVKTVLWEDVGFSMGVLGATPKMVNAVAAALLELALQLKGFTGEILREFLRQLGSELDRDTLRALPGAWASLLEELLLEDPQALDEFIAALGAMAESLLRGAGSALRQAGRRADVGRIRQGVVKHFERRMEELPPEGEIYDPVIVSNLLGMVPAFLNYLLRLLTRLLRRLDLPSEILAHAVFQLLEDIDRRELANLVNAFSSFINSLHRGNLLLGGEEPRFKEVLRGVSRDLVELVDGDGLRQALIALGEDGKVVAEVVSEHLYSSPERTAAVAGALLAALQKGLGLAASLADRLATISPEGLEMLSRQVEEVVDPAEVARLLNSCSTLLRRLWEHPREAQPTSRFLSTLDRQELKGAFMAALARYSRPPYGPGEGGAGVPEILAETVNRALRSLNSLLEGRSAEIRQGLSRFARSLDRGEMRKAATGVLSLALARGEGRATPTGTRKAAPLVAGVMFTLYLLRRRRRKARIRAAGAPG
ncbi:MAG: hypothetical protein WHT46_02815 [Candidatus Geothermincolales bacterium]